MLLTLFSRIVFINILVSFSFMSTAQTRYNDARETTQCASCKAVIRDMPKEVLYGIHINLNGDVYFSMTDRNWFDKLFNNDSYGIAIDIISKTRYNCSIDISSNYNIPKGTVLPAVYRKQLLAGDNQLEPNGINVKVGKVPPSLLGKELEGNLIILNGTAICYYTNFVDIDRSVWELLPMGFYTDSLINESRNRSDTLDQEFFTYQRKIQIEIPFARGSSTFEANYLKKYLDSINLVSTTIKKVEIRAYSSVEGPEMVNKSLMAKRAESFINALKRYEPTLKRVKVLTAENWLDFYNDVKTTKFDKLTGKSKTDIKKQLADPSILVELEPILAKHRKVIAVLYVEGKTEAYFKSDSSLVKNINESIKSKQIRKAEMLLKELSNRIADNRLPVEAFEKIEVPRTKEYTPLLNDREVYKHLLKATDETEALENLIQIRQLDSTNGKLNYNICVLQFFMWRFDNDSAARKIIPRYIEKLVKQGIPDILVKRMKINYYILKSEDQLNDLNYSGKDSSVAEIRRTYENLHLSDEDIYSLAKYYSFYSHSEWAEEIILPRISDINVTEDLVFYYLNLLFYHPYSFGSTEFNTAALNAINLNRTRFCNFFRSVDKGGASMQLLEHGELKKIYCTECNK
jgi:hypothetical protein